MLCTVKLSRHFFPQHRHHNLDSIIQRHHILCEKRHRAFDDALALWSFFRQLQSRFGTQFETAMGIVMKRPSLPKGLSASILDSLPESPGVYILYGDQHAPLYVGKSVNIKERVLSHFSGDHTSTKEMSISQQVRQIETIHTAGELGALLKESRLIKDIQPLYNQQLRSAYKLLVMKVHLDKDGFLSPQLATIEQILPTEISDIIGIFKSKKQATGFLEMKADEYQLCKKRLGLEKVIHSCFGYKLGNCRGACLQKEPAHSYNERFMQALESTKIKPWLYHQPVIITEQNLLNSLSESFLVDKWCFLGSYQSDGYTHDLKLENKLVFDYDIYKILRRYLSNPAHKTKIKLVSYSQLQQYKNGFGYMY